MSKIARAAVVLAVAAQIVVVPAAANAAPAHKAGCLVWIWVDGWRCAFP
ncbi:MAG TPA: hypothetical protein VHI71_11285 [Actinomycetota bacterium]|nr:hypothetical protein [Actinomycetota bacterium]